MHTTRDDRLRKLPLRKVAAGVRSTSSTTNPIAVVEDWISRLCLPPSTIIYLGDCATLGVGCLFGSKALNLFFSFAFQGLSTFTSFASTPKPS